MNTTTTKKRAGRPAGTTKNRRPICLEEYRKFMQAIDSYDVSVERKCVIKRAVVLLRYGGFRISELTHLRYSDLLDLYMINRIALSNNTKTKKPRDVLFSDGAVSEIRNVFSCIDFKDENEVLFKGRGGVFDKRNPTAFGAELNRAISAIFGKQYSTHSFRAGYITDLFRANNDASVIQHTVGHSNVSTTLGYRFVEDADKVSAVDCLTGTEEVA